MAAGSPALNHPPHQASLPLSCKHTAGTPTVVDPSHPPACHRLVTCGPIPHRTSLAHPAHSLRAYYCTIGLHERKTRTTLPFRLLGSQTLHSACLLAVHATHSPLCHCCPHPCVQNSLASPDITSTDRRGRRRDTLLPPSPPACCLMSITHCTHTRVWRGGWYSV